ncbi:MAG: MerR family transcriptional regulator [Planctomycetes bacterium]|nr:MerR family transcriptional regulator [Planctomycetota bacterium]
MIDRARTAAAELLKIGDFARLAGTNLRTLRYYEELGLLRPARRSQGGFRYYRRTDINRLNMIRDLQELGLHLDRIRELMSTRESDEARSVFLERVREALREQDRLLQERVAALEHQRARLAAAVGKLTECECCKHLPIPSNNFCEPCVVTGQPLPAKVSALF